MGRTSSTRSLWSSKWAWSVRRWFYCGHRWQTQSQGMCWADPNLGRTNSSLNFLKNIISVRFWQLLRDAQRLSSRMNHRGACACDNDTGDGAGVLSAIPHDLFRNEWWVTFISISPFRHNEVVTGTAKQLVFAERVILAAKCSLSRDRCVCNVDCTWHNGNKPTD